MAKDGYVDPKWPNPNGPGDARIIIYGFVPSFALSVLSLVLFALTFITHALQVIRYRTWYFAPLLVGIAFEVIGYIARTLSAKKDPYRIVFFVLQYFFIVTAPVFLTASIYVTINKLIAWAKDVSNNIGRKPWLRPKLILWVFITSDIVTIVVQIAGAALIGKHESDNKDPTTPNNILLAGLAVQTFAFTGFLLILTAFILSLWNDPAFGHGLGRKRPFLAALFSASVLILLRIVFRLAETAQGVFGYLMVHEVFFGVLEFAPIISAMVILAYWHPGRWLRAPEQNSNKPSSSREHMSESAKDCGIVEQSVGLR